MRGELESIGKLWSAVAEVSVPCTEPRHEVLVQGHEPPTPLFFSAHNYPQHDAKAVSPLRSATALQICDLPDDPSGETKPESASKMP